MPPSTADQNLLFGILAVQMDFATPAQLVAAMNAWVLNKHKPLGEHLVDGGALEPATRDLLSALVTRHVEQHGGQVERSLSAISSTGGLCAELARIGDADVQASLRRVPAGPPRHVDRHATVASAATQSEEAQRFTILRPHATGGLGKVSVARDGELHREVALKELLDSHADDPDSRARFLQEAEITGGLEHPGVVPIYGLGQYADGRPFYAMRFIRGDSLRDAIERFHAQADPKWATVGAQLQLRRLLGRMIDVCNAIEYAHSRGVLHRDLKPGNIMLGQYGETLVVDWGLAKATGAAGMTVRLAGVNPDSTVRALPEPLLAPSGSGGSAPTQMGSAVGTPAFMSPEQAAGRLDALGPASDVFSLGATLYVLLTGRSPQEDNDLGVVLQRVQRGEFPLPRSIKPVVPKALEAICLKAMATLPEDRYHSPRAMADDLEAWLADEPVTALPEPLATRIRRWVKQHRTLVSTLAGVTVASLAAALIGVGVLTAANQREREAKEAAQTAKAEADLQSERNAELLALARRSLERYDTLSKSEELQRYGMEQLRGGLTEAALEFYETLAKQTGESEQARADRGEAFYRIGNTHWQLGRLPESLAAYQQARDIFEALERDFPDNRRYHRAAAVNNAAIGEYLTNTQQTETAAAPLAASRKRLQKLLDAKPGDADAGSLLAYGWGLEGERRRQTGDFPGAVECINRQIELLQRVVAQAADDAEQARLETSLAAALNHRAKIETDVLWQFDSAGDDYARARELFTKRYEAQPELSDVGLALAQTIRYQGELHARKNNAAAASSAFDEAIKLLTELDRAHPNVPHYQQELAESQFLLATVAIDPQEDPAVRKSRIDQITRAVAIVEKLLDRAPARTDLKLMLARFRGQQGVLLSQDGQEDRSQQEFAAAVALLDQLADNAGDNLDNWLGVASLTYGIAEQQRAAGNNDQALALFEQAQGQYERLRRMAPDFSQALLSIASIHLDRANIFIAEDRGVDALKELDEMAAASDELKDKSDAVWMQAGFRTLVVGAAAMRQLQAAQIRQGGLKQLAVDGRFDVLLDQAVAWGAYTKKAGDHFVGAEALASGAAAAQVAEGLAEPERAALGERLAAAAVAELKQAYEGGYIRPSGGWSSLFASRPTLADLEEDDQWKPLRERADFRELIDRIHAEAEDAGDPQQAPEAAAGTEPQAAENP